ncbi:hypothetical protein GTP58_05225 [Duganella sp. CY15W]|nr:hypothetical protein [Duganella sp. CY15W]
MKKQNIKIYRQDRNNKIYQWQPRLYSDHTFQRIREHIMKRLQNLPLPLSAIALLTAFVLGNFDYQTAGWAFFGIGIVAWARLDAKQLLKSDRYGFSPAIAVLAYPALAGAQANVAITFALALHALLVFLILMSRHLSEDIAQAFSQKQGISQRI